MNIVKVFKNDSRALPTEKNRAIEQRKDSNAKNQERKKATKPRQQERLRENLLLQKRVQQLERDMKRQTQEQIALQMRLRREQDGRDRDRRRRDRSRRRTRDRRRRDRDRDRDRSKDRLKKVSEKCEHCGKTNVFKVPPGVRSFSVQCIKCKKDFTLHVGEKPRQQTEPAQVVYAGKPPPNYEESKRKNIRSGRSSSSGNSGSRSKKKKKKRLIPSPLRPTQDNHVSYRVVVPSLSVSIGPKPTDTVITKLKQNNIVMADDMTNVDNTTRVHIVKPCYGWVSAFDQTNNNTIELNEQREYTLVFKQKPLGFKVLGDELWHNAIVTSLIDKTCGVVVGSFIMRINHIYVHGMPHDQIGKIAKTQPPPLEITFLKPYHDVVVGNKKSKRTFSSLGMDVSAPTLQQLYGVSGGGHPTGLNQAAADTKTQVQQASHTITPNAPPVAGAGAGADVGMYAHQQNIHQQQTYPQLPSPHQHNRTSYGPPLPQQQIQPQAIQQQQITNRTPYQAPLQSIPNTIAPQPMWRAQHSIRPPGVMVKPERPRQQVMVPPIRIPQYGNHIAPQVFHSPSRSYESDGTGSSVSGRETSKSNSHRKSPQTQITDADPIQGREPSPSNTLTTITGKPDDQMSEYTDMTHGKRNHQRQPTYGAYDPALDYAETYGLDVPIDPLDPFIEFPPEPDEYDPNADDFYPPDAYLDEFGRNDRSIYGGDVYNQRHNSTMSSMLQDLPYGNHEEFDGMEDDHGYILDPQDNVFDPRTLRHQQTNLSEGEQVNVTSTVQPRITEEDNYSQTESSFYEPPMYEGVIQQPNLPAREPNSVNQIHADLARRASTIDNSDMDEPKLQHLSQRGVMSLWNNGKSLKEIMKTYTIKRTRRNSNMLKEMIRDGLDRGGDSGSDGSETTEIAPHTTPNLHSKQSTFPSIPLYYNMFRSGDEAGTVDMTDQDTEKVEEETVVSMSDDEDEEIIPPPAPVKLPPKRLSIVSHLKEEMVERTPSPASHAIESVPELPKTIIRERTLSGDDTDSYAIPPPFMSPKPIASKEPLSVRIPSIITADAPSTAGPMSPHHFSQSSQPSMFLNHHNIRQLSFHDFIFHCLEAGMGGSGQVDFRLFKYGLMQVGLVNMDDSAYLKLYQYIDDLNQGVILIQDVASFVETTCHMLELETFRLMLHDLIKRQYDRYLLNLPDGKPTETSGFLEEDDAIAGPPESVARSDSDSHNPVPYSLPSQILSDDNETPSSVQFPKPFIKPLDTTVQTDFIPPSPRRRPSGPFIPDEMYKNVDSLLQNDDESHSNVDPFDTISYKSFVTKSDGKSSIRPQDPIETLFEIVADGFKGAPDMVVRNIVYFLGHSVSTLSGHIYPVDFRNNCQVGALFQPLWDVEYPVKLSRVHFPLRLQGGASVRYRIVIRGYDGPWEDEIFYEGDWDTLDGPILNGMVSFEPGRELYTHDIARYVIYLELASVIGEFSLDCKPSSPSQPFCTFLHRDDDDDDWIMDSTQVICCLLEFTSFDYEDLEDSLFMSSQINDT